MSGIKKKDRQRIKKYADMMAKTNPDYRYDCFLQAYEEANPRVRVFYDLEMKKAFELSLEGEQ